MCVYVYMYIYTIIYIYIYITIVTPPTSSPPVPPVPPCSSRWWCRRDPRNRPRRVRRCPRWPPARGSRRGAANRCRGTSCPRLRRWGRSGRTCLGEGGKMRWKSWDLYIICMNIYIYMYICMNIYMYIYMYIQYIYVYDRTEHSKTQVRVGMMGWCWTSSKHKGSIRLRAGNKEMVVTGKHCNNMSTCQLFSV